MAPGLAEASRSRNAGMGGPRNPLTSAENAALLKAVNNIPPKELAIKEGMGTRDR
jgi:hypothetical protein